MGSLKVNVHGAQDDEIKHVEHPHKTRMPILIPGANNSTSREKFIAQAIFSYHGFCWLWQHLCLKEYVIPGELSVLVNGNIGKGQHRFSSANTTPRGSFISHTFSFSRSIEETMRGHFTSNIHGDQDVAIKHVEHPHKTRMQILSPGANNSTSRDKFSAQAIFSYHAT